jgi:cyclic-di-GMP phosphodiesterase, flagellum assembly factor TipF
LAFGKWSGASDNGVRMVRIRVIFMAACIVLIAAALGGVLYLRLGFSSTDAVLVALCLPAAAAVYNAVAADKRERAAVSQQVSELARGSTDLARQLAEFDQRLGAAEGKVETVLDKALAATAPLAGEVEELSRLVKQLADLAAAHDVMLARPRADGQGAPHAAAETSPAATIAAAKPADPASTPVVREIAAFSGLDRDAIIAAVRGAIEGGRIDLYLQPIVTLPQRKVRYYEAMSRLNAENGEIVAAGDFLPYAEAGSLLPKLDGLAVSRCVQVVRRLLLKSRDIGLFCNLSAATLTDASFPQLLEFIDANRAIAPSLIFEFAQSEVRAMGPAEHAGLAALAGRGFHFSMDNLSDLRIEPRELTERGFRFTKVPAALLLNRAAASTDVQAAEFSNLLGSFGIDLIAERIESEPIVVDLLDCDVRFGQGFLFSPPRPVRPDALQGVAGDAAPAAPGGGAAQLVHAGSAHN